VHDAKVLTLLMQFTSDQQEIDRRPDIIALLIVKTKGRPQQKRLTSAVERAQKSLKRAHFDPALDSNTAKGSSSAMTTEAVTGPCKPADVRSKRHCRKCGEAGHYATTCSRRA
jgi:hypothetical protein